MIAPRSENIEKTATGVPPLAPAASPTEAAGAVPSAAAATPPRHRTPMNSHQFGTSGRVAMTVAPSRPPTIMAGLRPTWSTNFPTGARATVCTTAAMAKA